MLKKIINLCFIVLVFAFLTVGLVKTTAFPEEINPYENRYANRASAPSAESYLSAAFQDSLEDALSDQIPAAIEMKKQFNELSRRYTLSVVLPLSKANPDQYVAFENLRLYGGDTIVYWTRSEKSVDDALRERADNLNAIIHAHPDKAFYLYYIEKDTDIDFEYQKKSNIYDALVSYVDIPFEKTGCYRVDDFEFFHETFYRTDHHWNEKGSYLGYKKVLDLLTDGAENDYIVPVEWQDLPYTFAGSKAKSVGCTDWQEPFNAYVYDIPRLNTTINGKEAYQYGQQDYYFQGGGVGISYGNFYGGDDGEVILTSGNDGENVLIIGESFDNAILNLLAQHFGTTYAVDLRYYRTYMGEDFHLSSYLGEHKIDKILFIGNLDYYIMSDFALED